MRAFFINKKPCLILSRVPNRYAISDKFDNSHLGCVSTTRTSFRDAGITAVTICIFRRYFIKQLFSNRFLRDIGINLAFAVKGAFLAESDHLFGHGTYLFGT